MIGDVIDYLDFSETHIEWQLRLKLQEIRRRDKVEDFPPGYRQHLVENAEFRFGASLPLRVRYSALISLVTSVEWSIGHLVKHLDVSVPKTKNENETIRSMKSLQDLTDLQRNEDIRTFEDLVRVRNCIAHSAGLIEDDKYPEQVAESVQRLDGFSLENWHFIGPHVCIGRGSLNPYAEMLKQLVVELHKGGNRQSTESSK